LVFGQPKHIEKTFIHLTDKLFIIYSNPNTEITDMAENLELTATETEGTANDTDPVTHQDLAEVIQEFEQYRQRLLDDMTTAAQKAKLPKSKLMARLEPELAQIDSTLENLRAQYAALTGH
jgi:maltooligosyltrehalose synthase